MVKTGPYLRGVLLRLELRATLGTLTRPLLLLCCRSLLLRLFLPLGLLNWIERRALHHVREEVVEVRLRGRRAADLRLLDDSIGGGVRGVVPEAETRRRWLRRWLRLGLGLRFGRGRRLGLFLGLGLGLLFAVNVRKE